MKQMESYKPKPVEGKMEKVTCRFCGGNHAVVECKGLNNVSEKNILETVVGSIKHFGIEKFGDAGMGMIFGQLSNDQEKRKKVEDALIGFYNLGERVKVKEFNGMETEIFKSNTLKVNRGGREGLIRLDKIPFGIDTNSNIYGTRLIGENNQTIFGSFDLLDYTSVEVIDNKEQELAKFREQGKSAFDQKAA